jgi:hypothetical protein
MEQRRPVLLALSAASEGFCSAYIAKNRMKAAPMTTSANDH